jgi:aryl-alcohol dehydrogenase-like predicted oxidoreductase
MWPEARIREACELADRMGEYRPQSEQPSYSLASRRIEVNGVLEACADRGMGLVVYSPLAQGVLTGKYSGGTIPSDSRAANDEMNEFLKNRMDAELVQRVDRLRPFAEELGISLATFALAWILRKQEVTSAIIGASKPEQIKENAAASEVTLPDRMVASVNEIFPSEL